MTAPPAASHSSIHGIVPQIFSPHMQQIYMQMLRSSWYQDWFNAVDRSGSMYYNRWGDAPIRFIGLSLHLSAEKILQVNGCRHG